MKNQVAFIVVVVNITLLLGAIPTASWADEPVPPPQINEQSAMDNFKQGSSLFSEEKYVEAALAFRKAYAAKPSWKIWYNIGQAETAATQYGLGLVAFETYLAEGGDQVPEERSNEVLAEITRLRVLVGSIDVVAENDCVVKINGTIRGTTPLAGLLKIAAGKQHTVVIEKDGKILLERTLRLSGGDQRTITVPKTDAPVTEPATQPTAEPATTPSVAPQQINPAPEPVTATAPAPAPSKSKALKTAGIILLATGAAALIGGGVTGGLALSKANSLDTECPNDTCSTVDAVDDMYSSQALGTVSTILFSAGGALAVTGVILLVVNKKKHTESISRIQFLPVAGGQNNEQFAGAMLKGRF